MRQACLLFAELALEADRAREPGGDQQPEDALPHLQLRADGVATPPPPRAARSRLRDPARGEVEQRVEALARERVPLGSGLNLDEVSVPVITTFMSVSARASSA